MLRLVWKKRYWIQCLEHQCHETAESPGVTSPGRPAETPSTNVPSYTRSWTEPPEEVSIAWASLLGYRTFKSSNPTKQQQPRISSSHPPCGRALYPTLFPSGIAHSLLQQRLTHSWHFTGQGRFWTLGQQGFQGCPWIRGHMEATNHSPKLTSMLGADEEDCIKWLDLRPG